MGLRDILFKRTPKPIVLPAILEPSDPVNFDSVLDWAVGLSSEDYDKFFQIANIYRTADVDAGLVLGVKHKAVNKLMPKKLTGKQIDDGLDLMLETHPDDLKAAMLIDHVKPKSRKKVTKK